MSDRELVLALARAHVPGGLGWRGLRRVDLAPLLAAAERHGSYRPRDELEADPAWKQLIPYLVLRDGERIFLMRRSRAGGDRRLHERWSLGIGGHVNPGDGGIVGGLAREWREELEAAFQPLFEPLGLLNDDETDVGTVHLGLVYVADAAGRRVVVRETHKLEGEFALLDAARAARVHMESWSALLLDELAAEWARRAASGAGAARVPWT